MRILFIVRSIGIGGASKQLVITANALMDKKYDVSIFSYCWDIRHKQLSEKVKYIPSKRYRKIGEYIHAISDIRRIIKKEKPDVVISWRTNAGCFTRLASLGLDCKVVFSERSDPYMETSAFLKFATWVCGFSDGGVFQTEMARNYYKRLKNKSVVIPNPISIKTFKIIPYKERFNEIAFVGRCFLKQKRQDIMLKAFEIILRKYPEMKLIFYGGDFDIEKIRQMVEEMGLLKNVTFAGTVDNVLERISTAKILALSSDYEGIPNVLLEAMSVGVPVVSTDTSPGGARVVVENEVNGYIVPQRDYEKLAEKIIFLLENPSVAEKFIKEGQENIKRFEPDVIFEKWDTFLKNMTNEEK